ncbi:MAG: cation-transporting P-type ATPase, partial [Lactobacillus iners]|nr:cation-transporting P-type ATPase [Lactobacillus iners]
MIKIKKKTSSNATNRKFLQEVAMEELTTTFERYDSSGKGLSTSQAEQMREKYGRNEIAKNEHNTKAHFLFEAFMTPFTVVLLILATLSLFTNYILVPASDKDLSTVIIMITMVLISGLTSFIQNVKTNDAVQSLLK